MVGGNPIGDLARALAIPGQVFGEVAVGFGAEIAEAAYYVHAHFFAPANRRVRLEQRQQVRRPIAAIEQHLDVPRLMVDASGDDVHVGLPNTPVAGVFVRAVAVDVALEQPRQQVVAALHAVAKADGLHVAVIQRRPGVHGHWVGVVEQHMTGSVALDLLAKFQNHRHRALSVEQAAGTDGVADALIDAVFQRDFHVRAETLQAADPRRVDDVIHTIEGGFAL